MIQDREQLLPNFGIILNMKQGIKYFKSRDICEIRRPKVSISFNFIC